MERIWEEVLNNGEKIVIVCKPMMEKALDLVTQEGMGPLSEGIMGMGALVILSPALPILRGALMIRKLISCIG